MAYKVSPDKLTAARGRLMSKLQREVTWKEFAEMSSVIPGTMANLLHGRSNGSPTTVKKIIAALREHGVPILVEDLLVEVPRQK